MMTEKQLAQQRGIHAEQQAVEFLLKQGLTLLERNFRCPYGELDVIMQDGTTLVIVEVRFRTSQAFGGAIGSITPQKRNKLIAATQYYLMNFDLQPAVRFDVVAVSPDKLDWITNAFQA